MVRIDFSLKLNCVHRPAHWPWELCYKTCEDEHLSLHSFIFRVVQVSLFLTGMCMWFFWVFTYMTQMNPLIGPVLNQRALIAVKYYWGVSIFLSHIQV